MKTIKVKRNEHTTHTGWCRAWHCVCLLVWRMMKEEKTEKEKKKLKSKYSQNKIQTREEENWWKAMDGVERKHKSIAA